MRAYFLMVFAVLFVLSLGWIASCGDDDDSTGGRVGSDDDSDDDADDDIDDDVDDDSDDDSDDDIDDDVDDDIDDDADDDTDDDADDDSDDDVVGCQFMNGELAGGWDLTGEKNTTPPEPFDLDVTIAHSVGTCDFTMSGDDIPTVAGSIDQFAVSIEMPDAEPDTHFIMQGTINAAGTSIEGTVDVDLPPDVFTGTFELTKQ